MHMLELRGFVRRQPWKTMGWVVAVFACLGLGNLLLLNLFPEALPDTPLWFPISLSSNPSLNVAGLPYAVLFLLLLYGVVKAQRLSSRFWLAYLVGLAFILVGNLIQGNADLAFRQPLIASNNQYYHDALKITSWADWLSAFNAHQTELLVHSKTHPPFAVLLFYPFISFVGNRPLQIGLLFVLIASLAIFLLGLILSELGVEARRRNQLLILFAIIPAVNIYAAVSLDGVILMAGTLWLLGLIRLVCRPKFSASGALFFISGVLLVNVLTFAGAFLFIVSGLVGVLEYLQKRRRQVFMMTFVTAGLFLLLLFGLNQFFHYNHVQAFFTASQVEKAYAFRGTNAPLSFVVSRLECVSEIALFFSIGCLASLFCRDRLQLNPLDFHDNAPLTALVAVLTLVGLFLLGISHTGETARSWLLIYPFLVLFFYKSDHNLLKDLIVLCGVQTVVMQLFFWFFW